MTPDERLEATQFDTFWTPPQVTVVDEPGLLTLTCAQRDTQYNMTLRVRPAGQEDATVERLVELHGDCGSIVQVNPQCHSAAFEAALAARGYRRAERYYTYVLEVAAWQPGRHSAIAARPVQAMHELRAFMRVNDRAFDKQQARTEQELGQFLEAGNGPRIRRFVGWDGDQPVSAGGITAHPKLDIGFLWGGGTVPEARGKGAYSAVLGARIGWAADAGLRYVGLYARRETAAPVVEAQGFVRHGPMDYWRR